MKCTPVVEDQPPPQDVQLLEDHLNAYNMRRVGAYDGRSLAIFLRDDQGQPVAGLSAYTWAGLCEVEMVWVDEALRGQGYGSQLLHAAEQEARARGCSLIVLSTYSFQAPAFYQKHGYTIAGQIDDCPPGHTDYYLHKRLQNKGKP